MTTAATSGERVAERDMAALLADARSWRLGPRPEGDAPARQGHEGRDGSGRPRSRLGSLEERQLNGSDSAPHRERTRPGANPFGVVSQYPGDGCWIPRVQRTYGAERERVKG